MGFFSGSLTEGAVDYANVNFMNLVEDAGIPDLDETDGTSSYNQLALEGVAQSEENWRHIMEACAMLELTHFQESGEEYVYTEATSGGFIASAKAFFAKVWEKIKSLFRKFAVMLGSLTSSGKDFVKKYRKDIIANIHNIPSDAAIKGYKYTLDGVEGKLNTVASAVESKLTAIPTKTSGDLPGDFKKDNYDYEEEVEKIRGQIAGKSPMTSSEFNEWMHDFLRNNESSPIDVDITGPSVSAAMNELEGAESTKKSVNAVFKTLNQHFDKIDKALSKLEKDATANFPKTGDDAIKTSSNWITHVQRSIALNKAAANCFQTCNSAFLTASKENVNQCKRICVKVVSYKTKHEGYSFSHYEEGAGANFLEGVVLK